MQLVHAYNKVCERNDQSLFHYGFIQDLDPPLLSALDTPNGNLYDTAEYTEADYGGPRQYSTRTLAASLRIGAIAESPPGPQVPCSGQTRARQYGALESGCTAAMLTCHASDTLQ